MAIVRRGESSIGSRRDAARCGAVPSRRRGPQRRRYDAPAPRPEWRNGIRSRLKIGRSQGHEGSIPSSGTTHREDRAMRARRRSRAVGYPTNRLVAVIDDPAEAAAAIAELQAAGFSDRDLDILRGDEGADRMDGTGEVAAGLVGCAGRSTSRSWTSSSISPRTSARCVTGGRSSMVDVHGNEPKAQAVEVVKIPRWSATVDRAGAVPRASATAAPSPHNAKLLTAHLQVTN